MKIVFFFSLFAFLISQGINAQVKLGDNPQSIGPASLFELESTEQVLVITRVSSAELQAITPSMGALAYNTDEKCLFYHNGEVWVNLCEALGRSFTTQAIANEFPTIVITPLEESVNFEVGEIRSENIVDFSIGSQDIQNNSINSEKLADASVGAAELQDNAVTGRNMDFVDITLNDFINDVPFLVQGSVVAAAIFYDNSTSGLSGSDVQAAIDLLSSGLDAVDLQAIGDGTYVFTGSDGTTTSFDLNASALRFDNTSNGFTSTDVQGAIEEIQGGSSDDQTLTLSSTLLQIEDGNSVDLSGFLDNTDEQGLTLTGPLLAIENGNTVDLSGLTSGVNTDQQQILDFSFEPTTNRLTLEIENATSETVDLSSLDGAAADGSETRILGSSSILVEGIGTDTEPYNLSVIGGTGGADDQIAAEVPFTPTPNTVSDNVQAAIEELQTEIDGISSGGGTDDQIAAEVPFTPTANTVSDNVQAAIEELQTEIDGISGGGGTDDQIAAEVPFNPTGNTESVDVQAAIEELQTEMDGIDRSVPDPTDEVISLFELNGTTLEITEAGVLLPQVDLDLVFATDADVATAIADTEAADGDRDATNEIELPTGGNAGDVLSTDGAGIYTWIGSTSTDDQNIQGSSFDATSETLTIGIEGGTPENVSLADFALDTDVATAIAASAAADGDADDSNELNISFGVIGTDLVLSDAGNTFSIPLADLGNGTQIASEVSISDIAENFTSLFVEGALAELASRDASEVPLAPFLDLNADGTDETNVQEALEALLRPPSLPTSNSVQTDPLRTYDLNGGNLAFIGTGNIGIGSSLTSPQSKLDVDGQVQSRGGFASTGGTAGNPGYGFYTNGDTNTGMFRAAADQLAFSTGGVEALRVNASQNVGIGTDTPTERLEVQGNILASGTITPDFVFEKYFKGASDLNPQYEFKSLEEVYAFIQKNNHLPGVPSASEVALKGGILINRATEINLEKIEELFLHTIEQERKIQTLQTEKADLTAEVSQLKLRLERIEKLLLAKSEN